MRIAQVSPLHETVPPDNYGGTERIVGFLTEALTALGHDVTLFAAAGSRSSAELRICADRPLRHDPDCHDALAPHLLMMERVRREAGRFDVVHFHTDLVQMPLFAGSDVAMLSTLHGRLDDPCLGRFFSTWREMPLVAISEDQRRSRPEATFLGTVHHGLPEILLPARRGNGGYLAFLGRVSPEKGLLPAIRIARRACMPLRIAAKIDPTDRAFFEAEVRPALGDDTIFLGEIDDAGKADLLGGAAALLFPIDWPEPFGLVMIEAMACGTPVVAFPRGAAPEIVEHGRTGFLVEGEEAAASAVTEAGALDRGAIRRRFEQRFTARRMALDYVALYERLIGRRLRTSGETVHA